MFLFFPILYTEDTGHGDGDLFARVNSSKKKEFGQGEMWEFAKVEKIGLGFYKTVGNSFFDLKDCYRKIK